MTVLLTILAVVVYGLIRGGALFSPGPLNAQAGAPLGGVISHAALGSKCSACHTAFWKTTTMADYCMACHTDVAAQLQNPSKLHGNLQKNNPGATCRTCHQDHLGPDAALTNLSKANVSHDTFGYALTAHQLQTNGLPFSCNTCHVNGYSKFDQTVCTTCHLQIKPDFMQPHLLAYGENCLACGGCHTGSRSIANLKGTSQDCNSFHQKNDPHKDQFGTDCSACHNTSGWLQATFDHNHSSFKLTDAHANVPYANCQIINVFKGTPTACASCHPNPAFHTGLFIGTPCNQYHNTTACDPALFNRSHPNCGERSCLQHHRATC
jgi:hypothetical protein